ncbi:MAG: hypothetical protein AAGF90_24200, partial [Pseudomonadota bacterium]
MTINTVPLVIRDAADAWAKSLGTKVSWYDIDGTHKRVKPYIGNRYKLLEISTGSPSYAAPDFHPEADVVLTTSFNNKGSGTGRVEHAFSQTETDSFSFSFTEGVALSSTQSASVELSATLLGTGATGTVSTSFTTELS